MYYGNEVRNFKQVPKGENVKISQGELELGVGLIDKLTSEDFHRENYKDEYRIRVLAMLDEKSKGKEIVIDTAPAPKRGQVIDINGSPQAQHGKNAGEEEARTSVVSLN